MSDLASCDITCPSVREGYQTLIIESSTFKTHSIRDTGDAVDPTKIAECIDLLVNIVNYIGSKENA
jgi:hypothetical protein